MGRKVENEKLVKHLKEKWKSQKCPMCSSPVWAVSDTFFEIREFRDGNLATGVPLIPIVPITCENCGNTILINAIKAGLIGPQK